MAKKLTCAFHGARGKAKTFLGRPHEIYVVATPQKKIVGNACGSCARQMLRAIGIDPYEKRAAKEGGGITLPSSNKVSQKFSQLVRPHGLTEEQLESLETSGDEVDQKAASAIRTLTAVGRQLLAENAALRVSAENYEDLSARI